MVDHLIDILSRHSLSILHGFKNFRTKGLNVRSYNVLKSVQVDNVRPRYEWKWIDRTMSARSPFSLLSDPLSALARDDFTMAR